MTGTVSAHPSQAAHAKVLSATPAIGSTITQAPTTVIVECAENINPDPKLSNLFVYSPAGELISLGNAKVSLNKPTEMSIDIKPDGNGIYVVRWITVSALDGDPDQGAFVFTVKPAVVAATPTTTSNTTTTTTPTTTGTGGGTPVWVPILVGIVALLVGLAAGLGLGRNSARAKPSALSTMRETLAAEQQPKTPNKTT